jgi:hypothetical protein
MKVLCTGLLTEIKGGCRGGVPHRALRPGVLARMFEASAIRWLELGGGKELDEEVLAIVGIRSVQVSGRGIAVWQYHVTQREQDGGAVWDDFETNDCVREW